MGLMTTYIQYTTDSKILANVLKISSAFVPFRLFLPDRTALDASPPVLINPNGVYKNIETIKNITKHQNNIKQKTPKTVLRLVSPRFRFPQPYSGVHCSIGTDLSSVLCCIISFLVYGLVPFMLICCVDTFSVSVSVSDSEYTSRSQLFMHVPSILSTVVQTYNTHHIDHVTHSFLTAGFGVKNALIPSTFFFFFLVVVVVPVPIPEAVLDRTGLLPASWRSWAKWKSSCSCLWSLCCASSTPISVRKEHLEHVHCPALSDDGISDSMISITSSSALGATTGGMNEVDDSPFFLIVELEKKSVLALEPVCRVGNLGRFWVSPIALGIAPSDEAMRSEGDDVRCLFAMWSGLRGDEDVPAGAGGLFPKNPSIPC